MLIKIEKYTLKTYSRDLICVQMSNDTLTSSFDIRTCLNYLERNNVKGVKNQVESILVDFSTIDPSNIKDCFQTENYTIKKDTKNEYEVTDKRMKNNTRWIHRNNLLMKLYLLEINVLDVNSIEELVVAIEQLNIKFTKMMEN